MSERGAAGGSEPTVIRMGNDGMSDSDADILGGGRRKALMYFVRNGPLAIFSASLPGLVNYAIIVYLSYAYSLEAAGQYRLLFSYFTLAGLPTLQESTSPYVRAATLGPRSHLLGLLFGQLYAATLTAIAIVGAYFLTVSMGTAWLPSAMLPIALLTMFYYPFQLFVAHIQARQQFFKLAILTTIKFAIALGTFFAMLAVTRSVTSATIAQLATMTVTNLFCYYFVTRGDLEWDPSLLNPFKTFRRKEVREGTLLSFGLLLPGALEQVDKIIIGAVFGLEALGIYTLGFSTGRLLYNMLKPSLYVYYRHFVDKMPPKALLKRIFVAFTALGVTVAACFWIATHTIPAMYKFKGSEPVATVLFLSYGISIVDAAFSQAFAINKDTNSIHVFTGNLFSSIPCFMLFAFASYMPVHIALVMFAGYYPLRHGAAVAITSWRHGSAIRRAHAGR